MIQSAKEKHLEEIFKIEKRVFQKPWSKEQLENDIVFSANSENWVYLKNHKVVGYILGWKIKDEYHLNNIAVHPDFIRSRIGTKLILHIISLLISSNINVILLDVSANNISAQQCYQSLGFTTVGLRKDYYQQGDDTILYNLDLTKNG